jgi:hypothetical protein
VTIDPAWVARNIVTIEVPGVGKLRVHRLIAAALSTALVEVAPAGRAPAVAFAPQLISAGLGLSRHTWGIGLSLPTTPGDRSRTIARLAAAGFAWGGLWLNPSPDYYEWVGAAAP